LFRHGGKKGKKGGRNLRGGVGGWGKGEGEEGRACILLCGAKVVRDAPRG